MPFIRIDFRYIEIEYELWALGEFLKMVEPQIQFLCEQDPVLTFKELRDKGWDDDEAEVDMALQDIAERRRYVIPRFVRGPFVVALWACFESGILQLAEGGREAIGAKIEMKDQKGGNTLQRTKRYVESVLGIPFDQDRSRYARISDLLRIRNSLAHANGQEHGMEPPKWRLLSEALRRQGTPPDEYRGLVVLSDAYLREAYDDVCGCLRDLVLRIKTLGGKPATRS